MKLKIVVPINPKKKPPSLNEMIKAERTTFRKNGHFYCEGAILKKRWQSYFEVYIKKSVGNNKILNPFLIHYKYYYPDSRMDVGNIHAPIQKYMEDALQNAGVIVNDNQKWLRGFTADFYIDKSNPRIIVEIEELEENNEN